MNRLVDLTSAKKITKTIREDFSKRSFSTAFFLWLKNHWFLSKKNGFFWKKIFCSRNIFFIFSSRMVKLIFSADSKSTSSCLSSLWKSGDKGCYIFSKRVPIWHIDPIYVPTRQKFTKFRVIFRYLLFWHPPPPMIFLKNAILGQKSDPTWYIFLPSQFFADISKADHCGLKTPILMIFSLLNILSGFGVFANQPTLHSGGVSRGRVCVCSSWR